MGACVHVDLTGVDVVAAIAVIAVDRGVAEFDDTVNDVHNIGILKVPGKEEEVEIGASHGFGHLWVDRELAFLEVSFRHLPRQTNQSCNNFFGVGGDNGMANSGKSRTRTRASSPEAGKQQSIV